WIEGFGEAGTSTPHLDIGLPGHGAHSGRHVLDGGTVHEMHGVAERYAESDTGDREGDPPACTVGVEEEQEPQHARATIRVEFPCRRRTSTLWNYRARIEASWPHRQRGGYGAILGSSAPRRVRAARRLRDGRHRAPRRRRLERDPLQP